jgi:RNA polymerase sigma-70 factor (ECF subfamily)
MTLTHTLRRSQTTAAKWTLHPVPIHPLGVPRSPAADYSEEGVLLAGLREGDEAAFAWMVDCYSPPLMRLAAIYVSSRASAEEVVQETWVAVIRGIDGFEGRSSVKTWVYRILMNIARTRGARESRSIPFSSTPTALHEGSGPAFDPGRFLPESHEHWPGHWASFPQAWETEPEDRLLAEETMRLVKACIADLPPAQREVTVLRDVQGLSAAEACALLGITDASQRVLLHRGRSKIRAALESYFGATAS